MDGLVSTGIVSPSYNIKINFCFKKKNSRLFYAQFYFKSVDKGN